MMDRNPSPLIQCSQKVLEEINAVRETGDTNMLDTQSVQFVADKMGFFRLVMWIDDNRQDYRKGIIRGFEINDSGGDS